MYRCPSNSALVFSRFFEVLLRSKYTDDEVDFNQGKESILEVVYLFPSLTGLAEWTTLSVKQSKSAIL